MRAASCATKLPQFTRNGEDFHVGLDLQGGHPAMDYSEHERTYKGFLRFTQISIVLLVLLLAGMAFFLV